ncbi:MAG TPA: hypothetical protein PL188_07140 [Candidatus Cloacimonadota bacterium]|nr:hypothetical protein [Candidatus Cloacimonadota bacterium]
MELLALVDYQGRFGSKSFDDPYRSGMDKSLLRKLFLEKNIILNFVQMSDPEVFRKGKGSYVIYTSQEDCRYRYKSFIEDVVLGLELIGARTIPAYRYLRANNNKVFMEMLRSLMLPKDYQLGSEWFGTAEEALNRAKIRELPFVVKSAAGCGSKGVRLVTKEQEIMQVLHKTSKSQCIRRELWDIARAIRHKGYIRESRFREKYIIQNFVPRLQNDWKVLVYGDKYYVLRRNNRPRDFRASGSGLFSFDENVNELILENAERIKNFFGVPIISLDLAIAEDQVIVIEFQFIYFGTSTLEKSPHCYIKHNGTWMKLTEKPCLEREYVNSVSDFIERSQNESSIYL